MQIPLDVAALRYLIWSRVTVAQARPVVRADPRQLSNFGLYVVPDNRIVPQSGFKDHSWCALALAIEMHFVTANIHESPGWRLADVGGHKIDRKSTRLNSSHQIISYAVFCLKKKKNNNIDI